jgi:hypothetical protein
MFRFLRIKERAKGEIKDLMGAKIGLQISQPCFYLRGMPTAAIRRRGEGFLSKLPLVFPLNCKRFRVKGGREASLRRGERNFCHCDLKKSKFRENIFNYN